MERKQFGTRKVTLAAVSIVVLLAMILSFTLAWFAQMLASRDNTLASAGSDGAYVELWAQTAQSSGSFRDVEAADFSKSSGSGTSGVAIKREYFPPVSVNGYAVLDQDTLYPLSLIEEINQANNPYGEVRNPSNADEHNLLLNDNGLLPGDKITRRIFVYNTQAAEGVSYTLTFPKDKDAALQEVSYDLGEAVRIDTRKLTLKDDTSLSTANCAAAEVPELSSVDAANISTKSVTGRLEPGQFDVYEMTFTFLQSSSNYYENSPTNPNPTGGNLKLNVHVDATGGKETHYVSNILELREVLGLDDPTGGKLKHGETIRLTADIDLGADFITNQYFNLVLDGHKLTIWGLGISRPLDENGQDLFGTFDMDYGKTGGELIIKDKISIDAPKAAVRWNTNEINKTPKNETDVTLNPDKVAELNVRAFNGESALQPSGYTLPAIESTVYAPSDFMASCYMNTPDFSYGTGTEADPYIIATPQDYGKLMYDANSGTTYSGQYFQMVKNFDFINTTYLYSIGYYNRGSGLGSFAFSGSFDGCYHAVANATIKMRTQDDYCYSAIFGCIDGATIQHLARLDGGSDNPTDWVSGIAGLAVNSDCLISDCLNTATLNGDIAGGILLHSLSTNVKIINCYNAGKVTGSTSAGGIVGTIGGGGVAQSLTVENCYNSGEVTGSVSAAIIPSTNASPSIVPTATVKNSYALDTTNAKFTYHAANVGDSVSGFKTDAELAALAPTLGDAYKTSPDTANGYRYPLLKWQYNANAMDIGMILAEPFGGTGTELDPYTIENINQWKTLILETNYKGNTFTGKYFKLLNALDFTGIYSLPVGDYKTKAAFWGVFDGQYHAIENLSFVNKNYQNAGIFGYVYGGEIKNLGRRGGINKMACSSAGVVGRVALGGKITNCYNTADIFGTAEVAGVCGVLDNSSVVQNCFNTGKIQAIKNSVGGIGAIVYQGSTIQNCYNTGEVSSRGLSDISEEGIGGIGATTFMRNGPTIITDSYNAGTVSGPAGNVGAIYGGLLKLEPGGFTFTNCYGLTGSAPALIGELPDLTTGVAWENDMSTPAFLAKLNGGGASFVAAPSGKNNGMPVFQWQIDNNIWP